jgi:hypothetical protein
MAESRGTRRLARNDWTPEMVEERLVEAAMVLRRLPAERGQGYFSTWPQMFVEFRRFGRADAGADEIAVTVCRSHQQDGGGTLLDAVARARRCQDRLATGQRKALEGGLLDGWPRKGGGS